MAGLLDRIARQVKNSLEPKKTTYSRPKTMSQTANRTPVVVMPVAQKSDETVSVAEEQKPVFDKKPSISHENTKKEAVIITLEKEMTTENIVVENVPENKAIGKEDFLLNQIDEFRAKAQQLQKLMVTKESKVQELQDIVDEREIKAKELEYILDERQRKADVITEEMTKQIDNLIDKVTEKMEAIGVSLGRDLKEGQTFTERQLEELKDTFGTLNGQQLEEIKSTLGSLNTQQAEDLKEALSELNSQLEVVKTDLSDKVHSENVQCYRNLADILKSVEAKLDKANEIEKKVTSVHKCTVAIIVLSVINMIGLAGLAAIIVFLMLF